MKTSLKLSTITLAAGMLGCSSPNTADFKPVIHYEASTVSAVAGSVQGYWDGPAADAKFQGLGGLAVDASGSLYVTDLGTNGSDVTLYIRKVDPAGNVSTLVGGAPGDKDGPIGQASLGMPNGLAIAGDRLFVSDSNLNRIRLITGESTVSTLAGGVQGYADGPALEARFFLPRDVAAAPDGTVYVADQNSVRKISPSGVVSTLAGGSSPMLGSPTSAPVGGTYVSPRGLGVDPQGNVLVADGSPSILKITPAGEISRVAGASDNTMGYVDGPATQARFSWTQDVAADQDGNIFVADGSRLRRISPQGIVTTIAGANGFDGPRQYEGEGAKVTFGQIRSLAVDASGSLMVAHGSRISRVRLN